MDDKTTVSVTEGDTGIKIVIKISKEDLFWFSSNQIQMLYLANEKPLVDQLRIIFIMLLEVLSRGQKNA